MIWKAVSLFGGILESVLGPSIAFISPPLRWKRDMVVEGAVDFRMEHVVKFLYSVYSSFLAFSLPPNFLTLIFFFFSLKDESVL